MFRERNEDAIKRDRYYIKVYFKFNKQHLIIHERNFSFWIFLFFTTSHAINCWTKKSILEIFIPNHDTSITYYCKEFNLLLTDILTFWFIPIKYRLELQNVTFTNYKFLPYKVIRTIINSFIFIVHNSVYEWNLVTKAESICY